MNKKGYLFIELTIAIAVIAMVIIGLLQGLTVGILGTYRDSQINTALHLAQSQMEYIKSLPYCDGCDTYDKLDEPTGYTIYVDADDTVYGNGLQLITVNVSYQDKSVVLQGYKTDR